jgi:hypothetical protein
MTPAVLLAFAFFLVSLCAVSDVNAAVTVWAGPIKNPANGHTYYLLSNATWNDSEAKAISLGGHLATINDAAENQWVYDTFDPLLPGCGDTLWIGFNDAGQEGNFVWASGQPVTYTNWEAGQPDNAHGGEDFAHIWTQYDLPQLPADQGEWNDAADIGSGVGRPCGVVEVGTSPKALGNSYPGDVSAAEPVSLGSGNTFETLTDYETSGQNKLAFTRYYNSLAFASTLAISLGSQWRSTYDRYLYFGSSSVTVERADGQQIVFTLNGGVWTTDSDVDFKLAQAGTSWTLTDGYTQTLVYTGNQLTSVTDSYNRSLAFTYNGNLLNTVTTPDGLILTYGFDQSGVTPGVDDRLASISYSTSPVTSQSYVYENSAVPFALTGIIDENGKRYATWTYDATGRALTSQLGANANLTTINYDDATGDRMVTNALGEQEVYKFTTLQGVPKVTEIDRLADPTLHIAAAIQLFTYDSNGYTASQTDWNGNNGTLTTYVNDVHGQPTSITETSGTLQLRTTTVTYDPVFVHFGVNPSGWTPGSD